MKKKILIVLMSILACSALTGCGQSVTRSLGGSMTVELEPNRKLEEITWKGDSLWYLTRPMRSNDVAETHTFEESSRLGILEGTVTIVESKKE